MLLDAANEHQIDLTQSIMFGDSVKDVEAGDAAGVKLSVLYDPNDEASSHRKPRFKIGGYHSNALSASALNHLRCMVKRTFCDFHATHHACNFLGARFIIQSSDMRFCR